MGFSDYFSIMYPACWEGWLCRQSDPSFLWNLVVGRKFFDEHSLFLVTKSWNSCLRLQNFYFALKKEQIWEKSQVLHFFKIAISCFWEPAMRRFSLLRSVESFSTSFLPKELQNSEGSSSAQSSGSDFSRLAFIGNLNDFHRYSLWMQLMNHGEKNSDKNFRQRLRIRKSWKNVILSRT